MKIQLMSAALIAFAYFCGCTDGVVSPGSSVVADTGALALTPIEAPLLVTLVDATTITDSIALRSLAFTRAQITSHVVRTGSARDGIDALLTVGSLVAIDVNATRRFVFRGTRRTVDSLGTVSWAGELQGGLPGTITLTWTRPYNIHANIVASSNPVFAYSIAPLNSRILAITYLDLKIPG